MADSKKSTSRRGHIEETRRKIQVGVIVSRLHKHMKGELEMTATQLRAAEVLLRKAIPDLSATDITTQGESLSFNFGIAKPKDKKA